MPRVRDMTNEELLKYRIGEYIASEEDAHFLRGQKSAGIEIYKNLCRNYRDTSGSASASMLCDFVEKSFPEWV